MEKIWFSLQLKIIKMNLMLRTFFLLLFLIIQTNVMAQSNDAIQTSPSDFQWENRILVLIGNQESDSLVKQQVSALMGTEEGFRDRDLKTFFVFRNDKSRLDDTPLHPSSVKEILKQYGSDQPEFRILLIGKDGGVKLRQDNPVTVEDIFGLIDSMPMRQREMRRNNGR
jgi:hypothetical protein